MDYYSFYCGMNMEVYRYLGAHYTKEATTFRTFAPQAQRVELLLDNKAIEMNRVYNGSFFEITIPNVSVGCPYEYRIWFQGRYTDHCDPYGYMMQLRPDHKSLVWDIDNYTFNDNSWMKKRSDMRDKPLNIYEIHAGSFRKPNKPNTGINKFYNYEELGEILIPYLKVGNYNYVEFLPLCEHPSDKSWGYQITGYFSPTSRYGMPDQLKKLIDMLHRNNIGVILDFVPVHFALDEYGLRNYDGSALYEYPSQDIGLSEWGSCNFMHSRGEVSSFLKSSANYWLKEYHFDGLRIDAVSRIIFWMGDENRGVNGNAVNFIKTMNKELKERNPGCMLIAEDSTNYPNITDNGKKENLGFDYKWDLGWMHDTLDFLALEPAKRSENYHKLTFSMLYFKNENYLLPLSHDEVVHGKGTIVNKMYGSYEDKIKQARALYMYMMVHPGKKLNFMGNEIAQLREWDEEKEQDWHLTESNILHKHFYDYITKLNEVYLNNPAFYVLDYDEAGFYWADCHQEDRCIYAFMRKSDTERCLCIFNFSDKTQKNYKLSIDNVLKAEILLNSDDVKFGGNSEAVKMNVVGNTITLDMMPYSGIIMKLI